MPQLSEEIMMERYRLPKGLMLRIAAMRFMKIPLLCIAVLFIVFSVMGFIWDLRFLILAFMLLLIATPIIMFWLYMRYCLNLLMVMNTEEHTFSVSDKGIVCRWFPKRIYDSIDDISSENKEADDRKTEPEEEAREETILPEETKGIDVGIKGLTIWIKRKTNEVGFFYIPYITIPQGKADELLATLNGFVSKK